MLTPNPIILLTGKPHVGKTSIIINVANQLRDLAGGFYTHEIQSDGVRTGFQIVTLKGNGLQLATCLRDTKLERIVPFGRYFVSMDAIENIAIPAVREAIEKKQIIIIDEIGPMELLSSVFMELISELLESDHLILGTIVKRSHPFADIVKSHYRVIVKEVTIHNRDKLPLDIYGFLVEGNSHVFYGV